MPDQSKKSWSRRAYLKTIGAGSVAGLAVQSGSAAQETETPTEDWPDLSGTEVQVIIDETADPITNYWNGVSDSFEQATNATMNLEFVGRNIGGVQRVTQLLQAGSPPEIFAMNQNNATSFQTQGVLEPVTDVMSTVTSRVGEPPKNVEFQGEQWLMPLFYNITAWYWRGDLAEEAGLDRRPEWTWETATQYAEAVDGMDDINGTYVPAGSSVPTTYHLRAWLRTAEASIVRWDGDRMVVAFDEGQNRERMVETLNFLKQQYQYSPVASDSDFDSWARAVANAVSASGNYIGYRPKMFAIQNDREFAADIHAARMPENRSRMTDGNIDGLGTFRGANTDAAKTLMEFLAQPSQLVDLYKLNPVHDIPPYPEIREGEEYTSFLEQLPDAYTEEDTQAYQEEVANNFTTAIEATDPANPYAGTITGADALPNLVQAVMLDDEDPDDVVDDHAQQLQQTLDQAQQ